MKNQVKNDSLFVSFVLALVAVAVVSAPVDARPVAARRSGSKDDSASLLDTSRTKPLDAAENKILPRGGNDFLGMTGKALDEAGSALREASTSHTPTASAGQQPARAPDTMSSSIHLSDLLSDSAHPFLHDSASSSSSAVPPRQSAAKLKRKREPSAAAARATNAQPLGIPPAWERHIRSDEEREQLLSSETRDLVWRKLHNRERRATRENRAPPAVLTPKQQSLRDSSLATTLDREDFDSKDGKRFWSAYYRVDEREKEAKNMSPEKRDAFVARWASGSSRRRSGELTESQKALQKSEFFKPQDQVELDLKDPERSRKVWQRVRRRRKVAAQVSQKQQAGESNRRDEAPKNLIDAQRASTLALTATGYEAPPRWVSQAPKSPKAVRIESPQHSTDSDSDPASFAHLLEQDLLGSPKHSAQSNVHNALPDSERTRHSQHSPSSPSEEEEVQRAWHIPFDWEVR